MRLPLAPYGWLAALLLLLSLGGYAWRQGRRNEALRQELAQARAHGDQVEAALAQQNRAIEALRLAGEAQASHARAAAEAAARLQRRGLAQVQAVLQAPVPPDCTAAVRWAEAEARAMARESQGDLP